MARITTGVAPTISGWLAGRRLSRTSSRSWRRHSSPSSTPTRPTASMPCARSTPTTSPECAHDRPLVTSDSTVAREVAELTKRHGLPAVAQPSLVALLDALAADPHAPTTVRLPAQAVHTH